MGSNAPLSANWRSVEDNMYGLPWRGPPLAGSEGPRGDGPKVTEPGRTRAPPGRTLEKESCGRRGSGGPAGARRADRRSRKGDPGSRGFGVSEEAPERKSRGGRTKCILRARGRGGTTHSRAHRARSEGRLNRRSDRTGRMAREVADGSGSVRAGLDWCVSIGVEVRLRRQGENAQDESDRRGVDPKWHGGSRSHLAGVCRSGLPASAGM